MAQVVGNTKATTWVAIFLTMATAAEGYQRVARHEPGDPPHVITCGFGETNYDDPHLREGDICSISKSKQMLANNAIKYDRQAQRVIPKLAQFPPHRRAAIVDFTYNVGSGTLARSSVARYLNEGRVAEGCAALKKYNRANGKVLRGLIKRRKIEYDNCMRND